MGFDLNIPLVYDHQHHATWQYVVGAAAYLLFAFALLMAKKTGWDSNYWAGGPLRSRVVLLAFAANALIDAICLAARAAAFQPVISWACWLAAAGLLAITGAILYSTGRFLIRFLYKRQANTPE